jgi:hypothetical protein
VTLFAFSGIFRVGSGQALKPRHFKTIPFATTHPHAQNQAAYKSRVQAIILKSEYKDQYIPRDPASKGFPPALFSMACHRCGASLVGCRAAAGGRAVD